MKLQEETINSRLAQIAEWREQGLHAQDEDCDVDPETFCCRICGVDHSGDCPTCGGHGFHKPTCDEWVD